MNNRDDVVYENIDHTQIIHVYTPCIQTIVCIHHAADIFKKYRKKICVCTFSITSLCKESYI